MAPAYAQKVTLEVATAKPSLDSAFVEIRLKPASIDALHEFTRSQTGKQIKLISAGRVLATPLVQAPISGGTLQISGRFLSYQANELAESIAAAGTIDVEPM